LTHHDDIANLFFTWRNEWPRYPDLSQPHNGVRVQPVHELHCRRIFN